jgi:hypothetical protein
VRGALRLEHKEGRHMARIFGSPDEVKAWFDANYPLDRNMLRNRLARAERNPGPDWTRLTSKFSVRLHQGVWEVSGISLK